MTATTEAIEIEYLIPCAQMLQGPIRLMRVSGDGGEYWTAFKLDALNAWLAQHPVYRSDPGALWFSDSPDSGWSEFEYQGIFRVVGRSALGDNAWWVEALS